MIFKPDIIDLVPDGAAQTRSKRRATSKLVIHRFHVGDRTHQSVNDFFLTDPEGVASVTIARPYAEKKAIFQRWQKQRSIPYRFRKAAFPPYHFTVSNDGTIAQHLPLGTRGAHAAGSNHDSIGIAILCDMRTEKPSYKAFTAVVDLCYWLNASRKREKAYTIVGHDDVRGVPKQCPGQHFDLQTLKSWVSTLRKYTNKDNLV